MEKRSEISSRKSNLKKAFKLALRSLLTTPSLEPQEFSKAFPEFTSAEQARLHQLFIQVITSLHGNIEVDFESVCDETQAGTILDMVEQIVEEQSLDPLFSDKTNVGDVGHSLSAMKKNEIQHLTNLLEKAEEEKRIIGARIELLKSEKQDLSGSTDSIEKVKTQILNYKALNSNALQ
ncbi:putative polyamine-modulated factor 1/Kinetochore protein NNF1 [Heracleum sosnowskyi]|uniref:Polyamine-modulated factor 1/Kinetochore protein NNF1 n=1 Tax=Heracleum sosnowskyi TaxID=360622 RepID=A0AAD8GQS5_9APIA|nr:putative polyamine-modulated factor 1/Kinetochore protein NNF1 [Heracleum sosnowskyi]